MTFLASNLRQRAAALGLSNAEVARRAGLSERTYGNYVLGRTEPNLDTLLAIAKVLGVSTDALLRAADQIDAPDAQLDRLLVTAQALSGSDLELLVAQAEAIALVRKKQGQT